MLCPLEQSDHALGAAQLPRLQEITNIYPGFEQCIAHQDVDRIR